MGKKGSNIFLLLAVGACLVWSCAKKDEARVIPRAVFSKIYAEMFLTDQWMLINDGNRQFPDTTLFYEPIFNKYGFTTDDYLRSVDYYLNDPERFARIVDKSVKILKEKQEGIEVIDKEERKIQDEL